uniref:Cytosolic iron-sulfur assembly component 2B n=1 Tax=Oncorhynchus mykiss TaxID=8022 RepID=A0A8C7QRS8_ONCMY
MATIIGLSIKVKLLRSLPEKFKIDVHITPGTHTSEDAVNKQLADKERVAAALELPASGGGQPVSDIQCKDKLTVLMDEYKILLSPGVDLMFLS